MRMGNFSIRITPFGFSRKGRLAIFGPESFRMIKDANVAVFERPSATSRVLGRLSYRMVAPQDAVVESGWEAIRYGTGKSGYVLSKYLIDPAGMSIRMRRKQGKWRLTGIATYCD